MTRPFIGVNGSRVREDDEGYSAGADHKTTPAGQRSICAVAHDIRKEWGEKVNCAAKPYLRAMLYGDYGFDNEYTVVLYFLSNASTFRGGNAAALKQELKTICGIR